MKSFTFTEQFYSARAKLPRQFQWPLAIAVREFQFCSLSLLLCPSASANLAKRSSHKIVGFISNHDSVSPTPSSMITRFSISHRAKPLTVRSSSFVSVMTFIYSAVCTLSLPSKNTTFALVLTLHSPYSLTLIRLEQIVERRKDIFHDKPITCEGRVVIYSVVKDSGWLSSRSTLELVTDFTNRWLKYRQPCSSCCN